MAANSTSKVKHVISHYLLVPAYITLIGSLVLRGMIAVLATAINYDAWPLSVRLGIEASVALGVILSGELILGAASASRAAKQNERRVVEGSDEFKPNTRLRGDRLRDQERILAAQKANRLDNLRREENEELFAMLFGGISSSSYGLIFAFVTIKNPTWQAILTEIVIMAAVPFAVYYFSAKYKEDAVDPLQRAMDKAMAITDNLVDAKGGRILANDYTNEDVEYLNGILPSSHKALVRPLYKRDTSVKYLTNPEVYAFFGVTDESKRSAMRRTIRRAGERGEHGVQQDPQSGEWRTPKSHLVDLFPGFFAGAGTDSHATNTRRTKRRVHDAKTAEMSEQGSNEVRASGDQPADDEGTGDAAPSEALEAVGVGVAGGETSQGEA